MPLPADFYSRPADQLAPALLGRRLCRRTPEGLTAGIIVETEAYLGSADPASHTFRGQTARNASMFGPGGLAYVYFTYGMHYCMNVVAGHAGVGEGVLLRALYPGKGLDIMAARRGTSNPRLLASGPARLAQAMAIDRSLDGTDLASDVLWIEPGREVPPALIASSPRIGIRQAAALPLRFYIRNNPYVSKQKLYNKPI